MEIEKVIGDAAAKIAKDIKANAIVSAERHKSGVYEENSLFYDVKVNIFKKENERFIKHEYKTKIKKPESGIAVPVKILLMDAISHKMIKKGDRVVCVQDGSLGSGYRGMLFVFDVDKLFFDISTHKLTENVKQVILEAVLDIAMELNKEGRESKRIGTAFVIGDRAILKYAKQLIINPFLALKEEARKITDPDLRETVKEFAQLDGVFMIDLEGTILSAGTYLNLETDKVFLPKGFGTRHQCCAAITDKTDAIAVVVSESGGKVRVFKKGRIVMSV